MKIMFYRKHNLLTASGLTPSLISLPVALKTGRSMGCLSSASSHAPVFKATGRKPNGLINKGTFLVDFFGEKKANARAA